MDPEIRESQDTQILLDRVQSGDDRALEELFGKHRHLIRRFVENRLDPQIRARVDASDIVQEAQLEMAKRIGEFLANKPMPFRLWVQQTAYENLIRLRRKHVKTEARSVQKEVWLPDRSSILLVQKLIGKDPTPSQHLAEQERAQQVRLALGKLQETDREILLLRTFDGLSNDEVAKILGLDKSAASKRYGRALLRLRKALLDAEK